jgi:diacylglycerol kinase (ATP)
MEVLAAAFLNSVRGFAFGARTERAIRQELVVLVVAIPAALAITSDLWIRVALIGSILLVLAVEFLNTGLEKLCDHLNPQHHPTIGAIKDMGSAAVLCTLTMAALAWGAALLQWFQG